MAQVVAAIIERGGCYLFGLRATHKRSAPDCWDLIGGHLEPGETALEALSREVVEELGVVPLGATCIDQLEFNDSFDGPSVLHLYRVEAWDGGEPTIANDEHTQLNWFWPEEIQVLPNLALDEYRTLIAGLSRPQT